MDTTVARWLVFVRCVRISVGLLFLIAVTCSGGEKVFSGADEKTPSRAMYFDWINHAWEGTSESATMANLDFFKWLYDEYGMKLDIYLLDAGTIDGWEKYGSMDSDSFKKRFPNGLKRIYEKARSFDCRIGMWLGPDGFGDTPEEEEARRDMLIKLCRDFDCALFKFDACCGNLRDGKLIELTEPLAEKKASEQIAKIVVEMLR